MKPLRILYTINNLNTAGMKYVIADLVRDLDRARFTPLIGVGQKTGSALELELERLCPVIELPLRIPRRPRHLLLPRLLKAARRLRGIADLAHSFDYASDWTEGMAMRLAGVPWVAEKTNLNWDEGRWWLRSFLASKIVCLSQSQLSLMPRWAGKSVIIPTGVALERFVDAEPLPREELGMGKDDVLVASIAHLVPVKGHVELIRAMAAVADELPRLKLLLAGEGSSEFVRELREQVASSGLKGRVLFLGSKSSIPALLKACDGKILATRNEGRREAFGAALVEAMAAGLPVIATRSGGPEDIVKEGQTGWLVDAEGWEPLAQALRELYVDEARRRRFGQAGLLRAQRLYDKALMARRYEEVYESVAGAPTPRSAALAYN